MTTHDLMETIGLQMLSQRLDESPPEHIEAECNVFSIELFRPGHDSKFTQKVYVGTAYQAPTMEQVLSELQVDMMAVEDGAWDDFDSFCAHYALDTDSLKLFKYFQATAEDVARQNREIQELLGPELYETFLNDLEFD